MAGLRDANTHLEHAINSRELKSLEENRQFDGVGAR